MFGIDLSFGFKHLVFLVLLFMGAFSLFYRLYKTPSFPNHESANMHDSAMPAFEKEPSIEVDTGFSHEGERYTNTKYGFSFNLPSLYIPRMQSYDETADILTFDAAGDNSFQIFIMAYDEPAINPERIKIDVPDIVIKNARAGTLDGAEALVFESFEESLGETYEVWFARDGYLYQMMTYADKAEEVNKVLGTWKFQ